jgi:hypothetical protein
MHGPLVIRHSPLESCQTSRLTNERFQDRAPCSKLDREFDRKEIGAPFS